MPVPKTNKRKVLYDTVSKEYNLGTYEEFDQKLNNPEKRKVLYNTVGEKYNLGTYEEFDAKVGAVEKKSEDESEVGSKDLSQPAKVQEQRLSIPGIGDATITPIPADSPLWGDAVEDTTPAPVIKPVVNPKTLQEKVDYLKQSIKTPVSPIDNTVIDIGLNINGKDIVEKERISSEVADAEKEAELKKIDNGVGVVSNFVAHVDQAFYGLPATILETVAIGANQVSRLREIGGGERIPTEEMPAYKLAKWYRESLAEIAPTNPAMQDDLDSKVATALGDLTALVVSGGGSRIPKAINELAQFTKASNVLVTGAKEAGKLLATPPALVGAMQMGVGEFNTAKASGASDDEAFDAFIKNAGVGSVLEAIPIMKFFKRLDTTTGGGVKKIIANGSVQGVEEMTTEVAQQMYSNVNAANTYDATRKWYDGMVESGGIGFGLGFFLGGMGTSLRKKHSEATTPEEKAQIQKAIDFVEEKGVELKIQQENIDNKVNENANTKEVDTSGETTENILQQQVPVSEEVVTESKPIEAKPEILNIENEAKKHASYSEFEAVLKGGKKNNKIDDSSISEYDIMTMHNPNLDENMEKGLLSNATEERLLKLLSPSTEIKNGKVKVYRATIGGFVRAGDYVTDVKEYAERHLDRQLGSRGERGDAKIIEIEVGLDELIDPSNGFHVFEKNEFFYAPKELQNTNPKDFFDKAKSEQEVVSNTSQGEDVALQEAKPVDVKQEKMTKLKTLMDEYSASNDKGKTPEKLQQIKLLARDELGFTVDQASSKGQVIIPEMKDFRIKNAETDTSESPNFLPLEKRSENSKKVINDVLTIAEAGDENILQAISNPLTGQTISLSKSVLKGAIKDIREGKNTIRAQRVMDILDPDNNGGNIGVSQGSGFLMQKASVPIDEYIKGFVPKEIVTDKDVDNTVAKNPEIEEALNEFTDENGDVDFDAIQEKFDSNPEFFTVFPLSLSEDQVTRLKEIAYEKRATKKENSGTVKEGVQVNAKLDQGSDSNDSKEKIINSFTVGYAPFREGKIEDLSDSEKAFENEKFQQWKQMAKDFATDLGITITEDNDSVGIYGTTSAKPEASSIVTVEGTPEQVELFAVLMGTMAPDVQHSVMLLKYDNNGTTTEHRISFNDRKSAEDFVNNRQKYGITDVSLIPSSNSVLVLDFGKFNLQKTLTDYGKSITGHEQRGVEDRFIKETEYSGIIQKARDSNKGYNTGTRGENLNNILKLAEKRAGEIVIPPSTPEDSIQDSEGDNQDASGIKKALVSDEIIAGVDLNKISEKDMHSLAEKLIATGEINPEAIVNEILQKHRALQPKEVVALIYYKAQLDNKLRDAYKEKNRLFEAGESTGTIDAEIRNTEIDVENFDIVAVITASQQSLAFRLRKGMLDKEYNLVVQINKYKSVNKGVIPPDVEAKFRELDKKLKEVNEQLAEAEKRAEQAEEELAIKNIKESIVRERIKTNIKIASKDLASKIRKAKFHKPGIFSSATPITLLVDTALEASASVIEAGGTIAQAIAEGWALIKKSDWYKGLNSDKQKEAEDAFSNMVSPKDPTDERLKIPNSLVRAAVEAGNDTIEDVTKFIHKAIKDDYPGVTEREIRDAITGYGKTVNMSKDEIDTQIRKIKRIGKIISSMEDIQNKKRPLKTGLQRDKLDAEERILGKQLKEAMKDLPLDAETEARQLKTSLDAVKSRLKNQIEDLNREIETGEKSAKAKAVPYDEEAKALIEERDRIKSLHDDIFGKSDLTDEQKLDRAIKSTERSIAETDRRIVEKDLEIKKSKPVDSSALKEARERLNRSREVLRKLQEDAGIPEKKRLEQTKKNAERRINQLQEKLKNNDFSKRVTKPVIADTELTKLLAEKLKIQEEFENAQYKNELKNRTFTQKAGDVALELLSSLWRALAASIDLSVLGVQGLFISARHPIDALHSLREMFKQIASEKYQKQAIANIKAQEWYPIMKASKLAIEEVDGKYNARAELFVSNWADIIWDLPANALEKVIGKNKFSDIYKKLNLYKASNRAYIGFLNTIRVMRFLDGAKYIESHGKTFESHPEEYKAWADYVNNASARASLGALETSAKALSLVFFSPRKLMSGLNLFTPYTFIYFGKMPPTARKKAIMDYASTLTILFTTAVLWEAAIKSDDEEEEDWEQFWNPNSSDFMKPKIENTRIDLFRGLQQQVVAMSRIITGNYVDSHGRKTKLGHRYGKEINTEWDVIGKFFSNKYAPSVAFGKKLADQKAGQEVDWMDESTQQFFPIWTRDVNELYKDHPKEIAIMLNLMTFFGGGVQTYGTKKNKKKVDK